MLTHLRIANYAIIDEVEVELGPGFTVMTGETGAGKSILVDALGLALGDRADASAVRHGSKRAEISAVFEIPDGHPALAWLDERGLDDELCCLRRLIGAEGRSRAFVNNQPVTLQDLRELGAMLVDIHGQHAHQSLLGSAAQRQLLDASAGLQDLAAETAAAFRAWRTAAAALRERSASSAEREAQLDLLRFQLAELEELAVQPSEFEALDTERDRLGNVDRLLEVVSAAVDGLYEADSGSAYALLAQARRGLDTVAGHDPALAALGERLRAAEIELKEAALDLLRYRDDLEADPARLDAVESRLDRIRQLARRHRVAESELAAVPVRLETEIASLDTSAESLAALERETEQAQAHYLELARRLAAGRRAHGAVLGTQVTARLRELGMPEAEFEVAIESRPEDKADATGLDRIEFQIRINPGQPAGPIAKVASGGELSRIGLALEVVATDASSIPSFVFDEVDAGIGGGVAEIVGRRLRQIAANRQVLCVTHLPQVASQGTAHFRIVKLTDGKSSRTQIRELGGHERVEELSRMLGGLEITAATRAHAEEMIRQAAVPEG
jgi:DNA repair protein RecN (Recombination protein N)